MGGGGEEGACKEDWQGISFCIQTILAPEATSSCREKPTKTHEEKRIASRKSFDSMVVEKTKDWR